MAYGFEIVFDIIINYIIVVFRNFGSPKLCFFLDISNISFWSASSVLPQPSSLFVESLNSPAAAAAAVDRTAVDGPTVRQHLQQQQAAQRQRQQHEAMARRLQQQQQALPQALLQDDVGVVQIAYNSRKRWRQHFFKVNFGLLLRILWRMTSISIKKIFFNFKTPNRECARLCGRIFILFGMNFEGIRCAWLFGFWFWKHYSLLIPKSIVFL